MKQIEKIYNELNKDKKYSEVYVEGFTGEQVYYQIEDICKEIISNTEEYLKREIRKGRKPKVVEQTASDKLEEPVKEESESSSGVEETVKGESECSSGEGPVIIENIGTDYSDCSSVEEDTYSEDEEDFDVEELKNKPAGDLFKVLDKNLRK